MVSAPSQGRNMYRFSDEEQQSLQEAMLLDMSDMCDDHCTSLPWLAIPDEAFCGLLLDMLPQDQSHRVVCAATSILGMRLEALTAPAAQIMVAAVGQLGMPLAG